ncbi:hypothetical protein HK096_011519, partial [Nowakowskiella sp. JEL0078]
MRLVKLATMSSQIKLLFKAMAHAKDGMLLILSCFLLALVTFSGFVFYAEIPYCVFEQDSRLWVFEKGSKQGSPCTYQSIIAALWWCVVTLSTTGYGDVVPVSIPAKIVAGFAMVCGLILFSTSVSLVSSALSVLHEEELVKGFLRGNQKQPEKQLKISLKRFNTLSSLIPTSKFKDALKLGAIIEHQRLWSKKASRTMKPDDRLLATKEQIQVEMEPNTPVKKLKFMANPRTLQRASSELLPPKPTLLYTPPVQLLHKSNNELNSNLTQFPDNQSYNFSLSDKSIRTSAPNLRAALKSKHSELLVHNLTLDAPSTEDLSIVLGNYSNYISHMANTHKQLNEDLNLLRS